MDATASLDLVLEQAVCTEPGLPCAFGVIVDAEGIRYLGARGERAAGSGQAASVDSVLSLYSVTKAITATLALRLVDAGLLELDTPAGDLLPAIDERRVLVAREPDGRLRTRPPTRRITVRMLLCHTAGFAYDFVDPTYDALVRERRVPNVGTGRRAALDVPLVDDPGTDWHYGIAIDWLGLVLEAATGQRLGDALRTHVLEPLDMPDTSFAPTAGQQARRTALHLRDPDGHAVARALGPTGRPEVDMGGHGLSSTLTDIGRFLQCWVAGGRIPGGRLLAPATVAMAFHDQLVGTQRVRPLAAVDPLVAHDLDLLPGVEVGWGLSWLLNLEPLATGRAAGSASWAGLANLWFWIDPAQRLAGMFATQLLPFGDPSAKVAATAFETAAYRHFRPLAVRAAS
ncbi:MAG: beta-lactamase family protein [Nitriliruptoraceae bacterium]|nr:beta-lactamase family protein [Nitriliruptoraceae bacterium]